LHVALLSSETHLVRDLDSLIDAEPLTLAADAGEQDAAQVALAEGGQHDCDQLSRHFWPRRNLQMT
jgi:hypothetical protein